MSAWADPAAADPASTVRVVKTPLSLPAAMTDGVAVSSVILADTVRVREAPYAPAEQAAHPYAVGLTEITPARDTVLAAGERLSVAFQIISARASEAGKPDVEAALRIVRVAGGREEPVAALTPQRYSAATLPANFDLRLGHPLLAAITAPVDSLRRGAYRLKIELTDRLGGRTAVAETDFSIAATATSLLKEAPAPAAPFDATVALSPEVRSYVVRTLQPAAPSPALRRALDAMAGGRFADLLDEPVSEAEEGVRAALRGLALLALDDGSSAVHFQRAQLLGAPRAPARLLSGAARALQGRDVDAIDAWQEALAAGAPPASRGSVPARRLRAAERLRARERPGRGHHAGALVAHVAAGSGRAAHRRGQGGGGGLAARPAPGRAARRRRRAVAAPARALRADRARRRGSGRRLRAARARLHRRRRAPMRRWPQTGSRSCDLR